MKGKHPYRNSNSIMSALVPKLLSVSLLHRHGARGPGGSELKPFEETSPTKQQWKKEEEEEITIVGNEQMIQLGTYFASKYIPIFNREGKDNLTGRTFWRSSKAARAKESGVSLVKGLNSFDKEYISVNGDVKYGKIPFILLLFFISYSYTYTHTYTYTYTYTYTDYWCIHIICLQM